MESIMIRTRRNNNRDMMCLPEVLIGSLQNEVLSLLCFEYLFIIRDSEMEETKQSYIC